MPTPGKETLREALLVLFTRLGPLHECDPDTPLVVRFRRDGAAVTFRFDADEITPFLSSTENLLAGLHINEVAIVRALTMEPMAGKQLAFALKVSYDGKLRGLLEPEAKLRARGLIEHVEGEGYRLTPLGQRQRSHLEGVERNGFHSNGTH